MLSKDRECALFPGWQVPIKLNSIALSSIGFTLVTTSVLSISTAAQAQADIIEMLLNSDRHLNENITQVQQLKDLSPSDWSYEAIRSLAEKYGCIEGFEAGTYQGDRNITRYEFAAGLNSCLKAIEDLVYDKYGLPKDTIIREDNSEIILATVAGETDQAESTVAILEYNQFSTTSKLFGEAVFSLSSVLSGSTNNGETDIDRIPYFGNQITLELASSFTGEDLLSIELEAANLPNLADVTDTFQGELAFRGTNDNSLEIRSH